MCFFDYFFKKIELDSSNNLTAALVEPKVYGSKVYGTKVYGSKACDTDSFSIVDIYPEKEARLRCQLCNLTYEVSILPCKHKLCKGCIETQKLYIYGPCLVCENKRWSDVIQSHS